MSKRGLTFVAAAVALLAAAWIFLQGEGDSRGAEVKQASGLVEPAAAALSPLLAAPTEAAKARVASDLAADSLATADGARTTLILIAVAKENGESLAHAEFTLSPASDAQRFKDLHAKCDANGRAEFSVEAGQAIVVDAILSAEPFSSAQQSVPPLGAGERREMRIELATVPDLNFWCRVVRDEDGAKLPFVRAELVFSHPTSGEPVRRALAADAEGLIELSTGSWNRSSLQVDLDGYAQAVAPVVAGHETSARAFELRLYRAAQLRILIVDPQSTPLPGLIVRAEAHDYELSQSELWSNRAEHVRSTFEATSDGEGRALLSGLPTRVELELCVRDRDKTLMRSPVKQRLEPGEQRDVQLVVGGKATLAGRALDQFERPLENAQLWLMKPDPSMGMTFHTWTNPSARTRTDEQGAFEFKDIAEGEWWLGPAPAAAGTATEGVAAYGQRVVIAPGAGRMEIVLHVWRALFISGSVRLNSGEAAGDCTVSAHALDVEHTGYLSAKTDATGAFKLGPVCGVEYEINAGGAFQGDFAESKAQHAAGGADNLLFIVERAARLRGTVIDPDTDQACDAAIFITQANVSEGFAHSMGSETSNKAFEMTGITPGVWDVSARSRNARMAMMRVTFAPGESKEITLRVAPSVTLIFKNTSPTEFYWVVPECNGLAMETSGVESGQEQRIAVPSGRVNLRIMDAQAKTLATRSLEIAPGASGEVTFP